MRSASYGILKPSASPNNLDVDDFSHIVVQLPCDVYIVASYLSEMGAPQRFGNPVVSVSNIKLHNGIEMLETFRIY
jgi:hypothetical protein